MGGIQSTSRTSTQPENSVTQSSNISGGKEDSSSNFAAVIEIGKNEGRTEFLEQFSNLKTTHHTAIKIKIHPQSKFNYLDHIDSLIEIIHFLTIRKDVKLIGYFKLTMPTVEMINNMQILTHNIYKLISLPNFSPQKLSLVIEKINYEKIFSYLNAFFSDSAIIDTFNKLSMQIGIDYVAYDGSEVYAFATTIQNNHPKIKLNPAVKKEENLPHHN